MANLLVMALLKHNGASLNVQSAFLHVAGDTLGSVAVVVGGIAIFFTNWYWVDPIASIVIACIIVLGSLRIVRESVIILLEATPGSLDVSAVVRSMYGVPGIRDIHDLHIWAITPDIRALSAHVLVDDITIGQGATVLSRLNEELEAHFRIGHSTIQLECAGCDPNELYCTLTPEGEAHAKVHVH